MQEPRTDRSSRRRAQGRRHMARGLDQLSGGQTAQGDVEEAEGGRQGRGKKGKEGREQRTGAEEQAAGGIELLDDYFGIRPFEVIPACPESSLFSTL
jgi:hypothetical protein